jgi:hypothetical protein
MFDGIELPVSYYAGEVRDDDPDLPELVGYEVQVGSHRGVAARQVLTELERFERRMQSVVARLDQEIPEGGRPTSSGLLGSVVTLCAVAHGEWVRIHPFANGNGRTARVWANWCALRYGLPVFIRLRPRPEGSCYARAAMESMEGRHEAMAEVFVDGLDQRLQSL